MGKRQDVKIDWARLMVKAAERGVRNSLEVVLVAMLFGASINAIMYVPIGILSAVFVKTLKLKLIG